MSERINELYEENNYPSADKLYKILKQNDIKMTLKEVKIFLANLEQEQLTKIVKNKTTNSVVAYYPFEFTNLDIFILDKYESANNKYKYILCYIDIFSRHVNCVPLKKKMMKPF